MKRLCRLSLFLLVLPPLGLFAQKTESGPTKKAEDPKELPKDADKDKSGKASPDDPAEVKENPRLKKLQQLPFDRRPSAILKLWAKPAKEDVRVVLFIGGFPHLLHDPLDLEMTALQRNVTLGQWNAVKTYLAKIKEDEARAGYKQLLQSLAGSPGGRFAGPEGPMMGMQPQMMQFQERNKFVADDVLGLAAASPRALDKDALGRIGGILRQAVDGGQVIEHIVARLKGEITKPEGQRALTKRQAALVLAAAGQAAQTGVFLPSPAQAAADKDHEALNLLTGHYMALYSKEKKTEHLEKAWATTQAVLSIGGAARAEIEEGLKRAVEIAPKIREELGQLWLDQSFTKGRSAAWTSWRPLARRRPTGSSPMPATPTRAPRRCSCKRPPSMRCCVRLPPSQPSGATP
jgi:hypothetical protein